MVTKNIAPRTPATIDIMIMALSVPECKAERKQKPFSTTPHTPKNTKPFLIFAYHEQTKKEGRPAKANFALLNKSRTIFYTHNFTGHLLLLLSLIYIVISTSKPHSTTSFNKRAGRLHFT